MVCAYREDSQKLNVRDSFDSDSNSQSELYMFKESDVYW